MECVVSNALALVWHRLAEKAIQLPVLTRNFLRLQRTYGAGSCKSDTGQIRRGNLGQRPRCSECQYQR